MQKVTKKDCLNTAEHCTNKKHFIWPASKKISDKINSCTPECADKAQVEVERGAVIEARKILGKKQAGWKCLLNYFLCLWEELRTAHLTALPDTIFFLVCACHFSIFLVFLAAGCLSELSLISMLLDFFGITMCLCFADLNVWPEWFTKSHWWLINQTWGSASQQEAWVTEQLSTISAWADMLYAQLTDAEQKNW